MLPVTRRFVLVPSLWFYLVRIEYYSKLVFFSQQLDIKTGNPFYKVTLLMSTSNTCKKCHWNVTTYRRRLRTSLRCSIHFVTLSVYMKGDLLTDIAEHDGQEDEAVRRTEQHYTEIHSEVEHL